MYILLYLIVLLHVCHGKIFPRNVACRIGETVSFTCSVDPQDNTDWFVLLLSGAANWNSFRQIVYKDGLMIDANDKIYSLTIGKKSIILNVHCVDEYVTGLYRCYSRTHETRYAAHLVVIDDLKCTNLTNETLTECSVLYTGVIPPIISQWDDVITSNCTNTEINFIWSKLVCNPITHNDTIFTVQFREKDWFPSHHQYLKYIEKIYWNDFIQDFNLTQFKSYIDQKDKYSLVNIGFELEGLIKRSHVKQAIARNAPIYKQRYLLNATLFDVVRLHTEVNDTIDITEYDDDDNDNDDVSIINNHGSAPQASNNHESASAADNNNIIICLILIGINTLLILTTLALMVSTLSIVRTYRQYIISFQ